MKGAPWYDVLRLFGADILVFIFALILLVIFKRTDVNEINGSSTTRKKKKRSDKIRVKRKIIAGIV